jgi:nucleotide-binding universal stress UspA family protein
MNVKLPLDSIIVGVDQTPGSRAALDFALQEGLARSCTVEIVTAWQWKSPNAGPGRTGTPESGKAIAFGAQDAVLQEALDALPSRPLLSQLVIHDYPAKVLVIRAENAAMLVVGSGRKNVMGQGPMGAVSEYCVRHSPIPVVVVPDRVHVGRAPRADVAQLTASGVMF